MVDGCSQILDRLLDAVLGMSNNQSADTAEVLDDALRPAQVLQRIDRVMCLFLSDLTASSLPLLELVRDCTSKSGKRLLRDPLQRRHDRCGKGGQLRCALICRPVIHLGGARANDLAGTRSAFLLGRLQ